VFLPLDLPEAPADVVVQVLDELRAARRELTDARRIVTMLTADPLAQPRGGIELQVATRRVELWRAQVLAVERQGRLLGLDVTSTL
jgi:hypothetical protein